MPPQQNDGVDNLKKDAKMMAKNLKPSKINRVKKKLANAKKLIAIGKTLITLISTILPVLLPVLAVYFVLVTLMQWANLLEFDDKTTTQNFQSVSSAHNNSVKPGEDGYYVLDEMSNGNLLIQSFYMNYANQSFYRYLDEADLDETPIRAGNEFLTTGVYGRTGQSRNDPGIPTPKEDTIVIDKYKNEGAFMLSHSFLWMLDEYVHNKEFRYPESFLRPVLMDYDTFQIKSLIENDQTQVQSTAYDSSGKRLEGELVDGVWDYGISPVIHYEQYDEDAKFVYELDEKEIWVCAEMKDGKCYDGEMVKKTLTEEDYTTHPGFDEYLADYPRTTFLIDKVATFLGTVTVDTSFEWRNTQRKAPSIQEYYTTKEVYHEEIIETSVCDRWTNGDCKIEVTVVDTRGETIQWETGDSCILSKPQGSTSIVQDVCQGRAVKTYTGYTEKYFSVPNLVTVETVKTVNLHIYYEGERWEQTAAYTSLPDTSNILGDAYFRDYLELYETYVPENVMNDFDLTNRISQNQEDLDAIMAQYEALKNKGDVITSGVINVGAADQQVLANAYRPEYLELFEKYGAMYGVDMYLLAAQAAQEAGGDHESNLNSRCLNAGCGLMQIEAPGVTVSRATAYNFETGSYETVNVCYPGQSNSPTAGCLDVYNLENNIKVGAMQLASRMKSYGYNILLSLQSYNFGEGATGVLLEIYESATGRSPQQVIQTPSDIGWMDYRLELHLNPCRYLARFSSKYCDTQRYETYGDDAYVEHVLRYYPTNRDITVYRAETGEAVTIAPVITSSVETQDIEERGFTSSISSAISGSVLSIKDFLINKWTYITDKFQTLFPDKEDFFDPPKENATYYRAGLGELAIERLTRLIIALEEEIPLSDVGALTLDDWKEQFDNIFPNPLKLTWGPGSDYGGTYDAYFDGQAVSPLTLSNPTILATFNSQVDGERHKGIDVFAPTGTKVRAIMGGTIASIWENSGHNRWTVTINHDNGMRSIYANLDEASIKHLAEGQTVSKGQEIGAVGEHDNSAYQYFHFELHQNGIPVDPSFLFVSNGGNYDGVLPEYTGDFIRPTDVGRITCGLYCYNYSSGKPHEAVDIGINHNTPSYVPKILAIADGVVTKVVTGSNTGYGNHIYVAYQVNGIKYTTVYAHLAEIYVSVGEIVSQGQVVALMGKSGTTNVHLHFAMYEGEVNFPYSIPPTNIDWAGNDIYTPYDNRGTNPYWTVPY